VARDGGAQLRGWLRAAAASAGRCVLVPGGGAFADAVRGAQRAIGFDDATAHRMALLSMDQAATMYCGLEPDLEPVSTIQEIEQALAGGRCPVWMPSMLACEASEIGASWDTTSDSLAAWLAIALRAEGLALVKSCAVPRPLPDAAALAQAGIVDAELPRWLAGSGLRFECLAAGEQDNLAGLVAIDSRDRSKR